MTEAQLNYFTDCYRRILYLNQLMIYNLESLKESSITTPAMKVASNNIKNAINRFNLVTSGYTRSETWQAAKDELTSDRAHDVSILFDTIVDVADLETIITAINMSKELKNDAA